MMIRLAWKNLVDNPLSMILSLILFALGAGLIALLLLMQRQLQENFEHNLAGVDLVVGAKGSPLQLILSSMYHIDSPTGNISLKEARPFLNPRHPLIGRAVPLSLGDSYRGFRIVGTTQAFTELYKTQIAAGRYWEENFEVTLGAQVASALGLQIGDEFRSSHGFEEGVDAGHVDHLAFHVVGILQPSGSVADQLILTTNQSYWLIHGTAHTEEPGSGHSDEGGAEGAHEATDDELGEDHTEHHIEHAEMPENLLDADESLDITSVLIQFKARNYQALNLQRNINENTDMQAATPAIEINRLYNLMGSGERLLRLLAWAIIIVSGLSIFISLYASLQERRYELALMRVMGAGRSKLFALIIIEGILLAGVGCLLGIVLSHAGMELLGNALEESYRYQFTGWRFLKEEVWLIGGSLLIGLIAATLPAIQAARTDIGTTLTEG